MNSNTSGAIISITAGTITVIGAILVISGTSRIRLPGWFTKNTEEEKSEPELSIDQDAVQWAMWWACQSMVLFYLIIGSVLLFAPRWVFGRTWYVYADIPHGGGGMGIACLGLAVAMMIGVVRRSKLFCSNVLFAGGITFWIAAFLVAAQGISAKTECIESLFMIYASIDMLIKAAVIRR